jgi:hypothetical protein
MCLFWHECGLDTQAFWATIRAYSFLALTGKLYGSIIQTDWQGVVAFHWRVSVS